MNGNISEEVINVFVQCFRINANRQRRVCLRIEINEEYPEVFTFALLMQGGSQIDGSS